MNKKFFSILLLLVMAVTLFPLTSFANTMTLEELRENYGAITVEAYNIGYGFIMEPSLYEKDGSSVGDITVRVLAQKNIGYKGDTSYFSGFEFDDTLEPQYPEYLIEKSYEFDGIGDGNQYLEEFDYSWTAGWCYTINDWWASWGADNAYPGATVTDYNTWEDVVLGDIIRWHFTVAGYGADCGFPGNVMAEWMGGNLFIQEDKSELIFLLAAINDYYGNSDSDTVYETALSVAANPMASASELAEQQAILTSYIANTYFGSGVTEEFQIIGYNGENVTISFPEEGADITLILADYENDALNILKPIPVTTQKTNGENQMMVPIDSAIPLSSEDKIMLWDNFGTCTPLCEAYIIN